MGRDGPGRLGGPGWGPWGPKPPGWGPEHGHHSGGFLGGCCEGICHMICACLSCLCCCGLLQDCFGGERRHPHPHGGPRRF
ncbi:unnamed protein product [Ilex paraguariensis]|uniref:Uncharacterized protein n=1 Tax=Ilex paraguariensis TaxID=185542 RepID=A0ABC8UDA4_9AQUA